MRKKPIDLKTVRDAARSLEAVEKDFPEIRGKWKPALRRALAEEERMQKAKQVAFRFPEDLVERIDKHVERMRAAAPGVNLGRADAVRSLLTLALDQVEAAESKRRK